MATITYYKAVDSGSDGSKGSQITSGQVDALLPYLSSQDRINGVTQLEKLYVQSDVDLSIFIGITSRGLFRGSILDSTGSDEVRSDVPSDRPRYGAAEITANSASNVTVKTPPDTIFRANDYVLVGDIVVQADSVTDNGDGTTTIAYKYDIPYSDQVGTNCASMLKTDLTGGNAKPYWIENVVPAGAPATSTSNTIPLIVVS